VNIQIKIQPYLGHRWSEGHGRFALRIEAAKRWLGDRYLLAQLINKPRSRKLEHA
jgi:hypothetical protein